MESRDCFTSKDLFAAADKVLTNVLKLCDNNKEDWTARIDEKYKTILLDAKCPDTIIWLPLIFEELRDVGKRNRGLLGTYPDWNGAEVRNHLDKVENATASHLQCELLSALHKAENNRRPYFEYGHIFLANQLDASERMILLERTSEKRPRLCIFCRDQNLVYIFDPLEAVLPKDHVEDHRFRLENIIKNRLVRLVDEYGVWSENAEFEVKVIWLTDEPFVRVTIEEFNRTKKSQLDAGLELMTMAVYLQCIRTKTEEMYGLGIRVSRHFKFYGDDLDKYTSNTRYPSYRSARDYRVQADFATFSHDSRQLTDGDPARFPVERSPGAEGHTGESHAVFAENLSVRQKQEHPVVDAASPDYSGISEPESIEDEVETRLVSNEPGSPELTVDIVIKKEGAHDESYVNQTPADIQVLTGANGIEDHTGAKRSLDAQPARVSPDPADESLQYDDLTSADYSDISEPENDEDEEEVTEARRSTAASPVCSLPDSQQEISVHIKQKPGEDFVEKMYPIQRQGESAGFLDHQSYPSVSYANHSITEHVSRGDDGLESLIRESLNLDKSTSAQEMPPGAAERPQYAKEVSAVKSEFIVSQPGSENQWAGQCSFGGLALHRVGDGPAGLTSGSGNVRKRRKQVQKTPPVSPTTTADSNVQRHLPSCSGDFARQETKSAEGRAAVQKSTIWPAAKLDEPSTDLKAPAVNHPRLRNPRLSGDLLDFEKPPRLSKKPADNEVYNISFLKNNTGFQPELSDLNGKNLPGAVNAALGTSAGAAINQEEMQEEVLLRDVRGGVKPISKGPVPAGISTMDVTAPAGSYDNGCLSSPMSHKGVDSKVFQPNKAFFQESFLVPPLEDDFPTCRDSPNAALTITTRTTSDCSHPVLNTSREETEPLPRKISVEYYLKNGGSTKPETMEMTSATAAVYSSPSPELLEIRSVESDEQQDSIDAQTSSFPVSFLTSDVLLLEALPIKHIFVEADDAPDQPQAVTLAIEQPVSRPLDLEQLRAALQEKKRTLGEKRAAKHYKLGKTGNGKIRTRNGRHRFSKFEDAPALPNGYPGLFETSTRPSKNPTALPRRTEKSRQNTIINHKQHLNRRETGQEVQRPELAPADSVRRSRKKRSSTRAERSKPAMENLLNSGSSGPLLALSNDTHPFKRCNLLDGVLKRGADNPENMGWTTNPVEQEPSSLKRIRDDLPVANESDDSDVKLETKLQKIMYNLDIGPARTPMESKEACAKKVKENNGPANNLDIDKKKGRAYTEIHKPIARKKVEADMGGASNAPKLERKAGRKKRMISDKGDRQRELDDLYCFGCGKCKKYFAHITGLEVHMKKTGHEGFVCNVCPAGAAGFCSQKAWEIWDHLEDDHGMFYGDVKQLLESLGCYKPELDIGGTESGM